MNKRIALFLFLFGGAFNIYAQYPPAAGQNGSTAIHQDSSIIINWANQCQIQRGWMNIQDTSLGKVSYGTENDAIGKADNHLLSLGDGGSAILSFEKPIMNGPGWDFIVFENSFNDDFLELAFVEVSTDGINYLRFPAHSLVPTTSQTTSYGITNPCLINNLAGKYRASYGTPFDLSELPQYLNIQQITHVKIVDVVGSINPLYGSTDTAGNMINDPFPTAFASGGFDLDAVGVIHQFVNLNEYQSTNIHLWPNPATDFIQINSLTQGQIKLIDMSGRIVLKQNYFQSSVRILTKEIKSGIYILSIKDQANIISKKVIIQ